MRAFLFLSRFSSAAARHFSSISRARTSAAERLFLGLGVDLGRARLGDCRRAFGVGAPFFGRRDGLAPLVVLGLDQVVPRLDPQPRNLRFRRYAPCQALDRARADVGP